MKSFMGILVAFAAVVLLAAPAEAGDHGRHHGGGHGWGHHGGHYNRYNDHVRIDIGTPYYEGRHCDDRPAYYAPRPVYYAPAPVYYAPPPQPVYYYNPGGFSFSYSSR